MYLSITPSKQYNGPNLENPERHPKTIKPLCTLVSIDCQLVLSLFVYYLNLSSLTSTHLTIILVITVLPSNFCERLRTPNVIFGFCQYESFFCFTITIKNLDHQNVAVQFFLNIEFLSGSNN